jgi:hypothetical protein
VVLAVKIPLIAADYKTVLVVEVATVEMLQKLFISDFDFLQN